MRFEELQAQSEEADLSEVVRGNSIFLLGDANFLLQYLGSYELHLRSWSGQTSSTHRGCHWQMVPLCRS